jgi:hypothetical protein
MKEKINPRELRLGSYVDLGNRIAKVIEIAYLSCVVVDLDETQDTIEDYDRVKGIPITEEWYEKLGLKKITTFNGAVCWGNDKFLHSGVHPECEYVHQLQNLFFVMTSEELTIKSEE